MQSGEISAVIFLDWQVILVMAPIREWYIVKHEQVMRLSRMGVFGDRSLLIRVEVWRVEQRLEIRDYRVKAGRAVA
jgi:hypothetical protein